MGPSRRGSWRWLALGAAGFFFAHGANNIALAAWIAPVFLLRFVRRERFRVWLPVLFVVGVAATMFQLRGMVPIPGFGYSIFLAVTAIEFLIPYALDRAMAPRIGSLAGTLVFPCAWTALDYLNSLGPYGSWGAAGYSQYGHLSLLQVLSVTGLWGVTFLLGWFAGVANMVWEQGWQSSRARLGAYLCAGTIAGVIVLGGLRMTLFPPRSQSVRIASLSKKQVGGEPSNATWNRLMSNKPTPDDLAVIRNWGAALDEDLLARAEREARAGARIVFWAEANAPVFKDDETGLVARGSQLASKFRIYLGMALAVWNTGKNPPLENKLVLIQPDGKVAWEYYKAHPVPGAEAAISVTKDGKLPSLDTPYGRLSSVICFDADFPQLLAQAGALGSDVVLDPSNDWAAIDPWHTQMASFRAIEQGVNLVRQTSQGLSAAYDYQGRQLAAVDYYRAADSDMISQVPTRGVRTIYSRLGDWFGWLSLAALTAFLAASFRRRRV